MTKLVKNISVNLLVICVYLLLPSGAGAAVLYLEPVSGEYQAGDTFMVEARIETEKECINTIEANLSFSKDILEALDFSQGNSILTLWLKSPSIDNQSGAISFIGGIPGGYCGPLPGDPGESNLLGKVIFKVKEISGGPTSAKIEFLESSQALLNDGFGTPAKLTSKEAVIKIAEVRPPQEFPKDEWQAELEKDTIPPETFKFEIQSEPNIFEGKYFIAFWTTDKQTGIDYYEIKEGKGEWKKTESPYQLEDQELQSIIKVKAVDKAGNEMTAEYLPPSKPFPYWIIILILMGAGITWQIVRKIKR